MRTAVPVGARTEGARVEVIVVVLHRDGRRGGPAEVPVLLLMVIFLLVWIRPTSRPLVPTVVSLSAFVVSVSIHYRYYRSARRWKLLGRGEIAAATLTITTVAFVSVVTVSSGRGGSGGGVKVLSLDGDQPRANARPLLGTVPSKMFNDAIDIDRHRVGHQTGGGSGQAFSATGHRHRHRHRHRRRRRRVAVVFRRIPAEAATPPVSGSGPSDDDVICLMVEGT